MLRGAFEPGWLGWVRNSLAPWIALGFALAAAAPEPPRFQPLERTANAAWRLRWDAEPGVRYQLETSSSIADSRLWTRLTTILADGPLVSYEDRPPVGATPRFYRLLRVDDLGDVTPPVLSGLRASPFSVVADEVVELSVSASDDTRVEAVDFMESGSLLGAASRVEADRWRFLWTVGFEANGSRLITAEARDAAGNRAVSDGLGVAVAIPARSESRRVGRVEVRARSFAAGAGGTDVPEGTMVAGLATISDATGVSLDPASGRMTGTGSIRVGGLGLVATGPFQLDGASGWVRGTPPAELALHPLWTLYPRALEANVVNGAIRGEGRIELSVGVSSEQMVSLAAPGGGAEFIVVLDGVFELEPTNQTMRFTGSASYRDVTLTGEGTLQIADAVFSLSGTLLVGGPGGTDASMVNASMRLVRPVDAEPEFELEGEPDLASLRALGVRLAGTLTRQGALSLTASTSGVLDALRFSTLRVALERPALVGARAALTINGALSLPRVGGTVVSGRLLSDGSMTNLVSLEPVTFGSLRVQPLVEGQPVLRLLNSLAGRHVFQVRGGFPTPEENGTRPVEVIGPLVLVSAGSALDVESLRLTNALPIPEWPLPQSLRLTNLNVILSLTNEVFEARLRGQLRLTREIRQSTNDTVARPTLLSLDAALSVNVDDAEDVSLDVALRAERIPLLSKVYLRDATFRLVSGSKPPRAGLGLVDGAIGLFPNYASEPAIPGRDDFRVFIQRVSAGFEFFGERFSARLTNGMVTLPTLFTNQPAGLCAGQRVASVALGANTAITLEFDPQPEPALTVRAQGSLDFRNLTFSPGFEGFGAELCQASLVFNPGGLPYLTNLQGAVQIPLPPGQTNRVELLGGAWELDGWPSGTVALMSDARLYERQGLSFTLLGRTNSHCPTGTALTVLPGEGFQPRTLILDGGMRVELPADLVTEVEGDRVSSLVCARLTLPGSPAALPSLELRNVEFGGDLHLGGGNGLQITNALLSLQNLENLFQMAPNRPVVVRVSGTVSVGNLPSLTLNDARFTFFDPNRPPRFDLAGLGYDERGFPLLQKIPARLSKASFTFDDREAPLSRLFHPTNINLKVSGVLAFPATGDPMFETSFDDAKIDVGEKGAAVFNGLDGLSMTLRGLAIPPIDDIGGRVFASGLSGGTSSAARLHGIPGGTGNGGFDLDNLFLAGRVVGSYQGYKVNLLVAFRVSGMVGVCIDVNAGSVGIPLDGGVLGGVLLTGASGGIALGTGFIDPCEFTSYLGPDGKPKPGVTALPPIVLDWGELRAKVAEAERKLRTFQGQLSGGGEAVSNPATTGGETTNARGGRTLSLAGPSLASFLPHVRYTNDFGLPCPGDCPPATINIFCQPHPDQERFPRRVIARFSSIDEPTLNRLGFTRDNVRERFAAGGDALAELPMLVARSIRVDALTRTPLPDPAALGSKAAEIQGFIDEGLDQLEENLGAILRARLADAAARSAEDVYAGVRDAVYEGAPCPDLTLSVSGTLTHTVVSSFLSGTVGAAISTAGSTGISGRVNVLGVPVGRAKGFLSATDDEGNLNPSVCAEMEVSVGPFELGTMRGSYAIENGPAGVLRVFEQLTRCVGDTLFAELVREVAPRIVVEGRTRPQIAAEMTPAEKVGFVAQLYSRPELPGELRACFRDGLEALMRDINPEILLCAEVSPRLFGLELGPSVLEAGLQVTKTEMTGVGSYSPTFLMATAFLASVSSLGGAVITLAGPLATSLFAADEATYGISYRVSDPLEPFLAAIDGRLQSPDALVAYLDRQFDSLVENATYTFAYSLSPLGFKTTDAQMRVVLPNLTAHPARPGASWVRPENRLGAGLPSRLDMILSALTNRLAGSSLGLVADPKWRGTEADLAQAFPAGSQERVAVSGLSFANDYFPHGGVVGGAYIQIPRAIYEAPARELAIALDPDQDLLTRLSQAMTWIQDYVLVTRQAGALGFYLPAPNPPVFTDRTGAALKPRVLLEAIRQREVNELGTPGAYPADEMFLRGWLDGQLLGIPIAKADLEAALADSQTGSEGLFRVRASVPRGSWLDEFSPGARFEFEMRQSPARPIQETFQARLNTLRDLLAGQPGEAVLRAALDDFLSELGHGLPKVKLEAELPLQLPASIRSVAEFNGGTWLYAYSPRYEPEYLPADTRPRARARREGGLAARGNLNLRALGSTVASIPDAELAVAPRDGRLPEITGEFQIAQMNLPGIPLRNARVEFATDPSPRYLASGAVDPFQVGLFRIESTTGGTLGGRVEVTAPSNGSGGGTMNVSFRPARVRLLAGTAALYGATPADDFSYRSDGPWTATADVGSSLVLVAGGVTVLELQSSAMVSPVRWDANGSTSGTVTAEIRGGSVLTVFPGRTFGQSLTLGGGAAGRVVARSDGTFEVTGVLGRTLDLAGLSALPVARVENASSFRLTQDGLTLTGRLGGGVLENAGGAGFTVAGAVTLLRDGAASSTGAAAFSVPPLISGRFILDAADGGPIQGALSPAGILLTGARMRFDGLVTNTLGAFAMDRRGDFSLDVGPITSGLGRFVFSGVQYRLIRSDGTLAVTNYLGRWQPPGLAQPIEVRGHFTSDGRIELRHSAPSMSLAGFSAGPVALAMERRSGDFPAALAAQSPRAWWSLNDTSGTRAANSVNPRADGTYVGLVVPDAKDVASAYPKNASARFNGGHVNAGNGADLANLGRGFSIAAWIKVGAFDRAWNTIVSKGDSSWRLQRDGTRSALGFDTDGVTPPYLAGSRAVDDGRWHHVVAIHDGRAKFLWIDGELDAWTPARGAIARQCVRRPDRGECPGDREAVERVDRRDRIVRSRAVGRRGLGAVPGRGRVGLRRERPPDGGGTGCGPERHAGPGRRRRLPGRGFPARRRPGRWPAPAVVGARPRRADRDR